jgi:hypothetical protein
MRTFVASLFCLVCITEIALALDEEESPGYRAAYVPQAIELDQLSIAPSKTRKGHFSYGETNGTVNGGFFRTGNVENTLLAGFRRIHLGLSSKIRPKDTWYGVLGITSRYRDAQRWDWQSAFVVQPDLVASNLARKTRYVIALHGRFEATQQIGLHVGLYSELGMRASFVHPLIGADYTAGSWLFQAVYPIKAGISYQGFARHAFSIMVRPFNTAVRTHKGLHDRPAIAHFAGTGGEFRWDYAPAALWNIWIALGRTLQGSLSIGDKHNNHRHHIHLHGAPYGNIGLTITL